MTDARTSILERIRAANQGTASIVAAQAEWVKIPRDYAAASSATRAEVIGLLRDRLLDYDATVTETLIWGLGEVVARTLADAGVRRIGISAGFDRADLLQGFEYVEDSNLTSFELDRIDAVLSRCTVAIAETGTLVLQGNAAQGRRALTLIPDTHVCIVNVSQVVATVPEAFARLEATATLPTTFVSGPSATADIEMTRIKGVHGPRFLHVVLVDDTQVTDQPEAGYEVKQ